MKWNRKSNYFDTDRDFVSRFRCSGRLSGNHDDKGKLMIQTLTWMIGKKLDAGNKIGN